MAHLIDKSAVVAEIEKRIKECDKLANAASDNNLSNSLQANELLIRQYTSLLSIIDTLEVKDVDLEKEIDIWYDKFAINNKFDWNGFAKHFFELGLNAQKGE